MILQILDGTSKTKAEIICAAQEKYSVKIGRWAVSRHLSLLKELGFRVD